MDKKNLFIIGNGFDVAHELKSQYSDFKEWFASSIYGENWRNGNFLDKLEAMPEVPLQQIYTVNGKIYNLYKEGRFLLWLIECAASKATDIEWNQFEHLLGKLDYKKVFEEYVGEDDIVPILVGVLGTLKDFFYEWIKTINITEKISADEKFKRIISPRKDLVLTFNYTETIERLYGVSDENICHLHGKCPPQQMKEQGGRYFGNGSSRLVVGHNEMDYDPDLKFDNYQEKEYIEKAKSLDLCLKKDSENVVYANKSFYEKIKNSDIAAVYSYGFSYSEADYLQIQKVCESLRGGEGVKWLFTSFDVKRGYYDKYKEIVTGLGFRGTFGIFDS